jgi:cysteine-rich repeat protein
MKKIILLSFVICILLVASLAIVDAAPKNKTQIHKKRYDHNWKLPPIPPSCGDGLLNQPWETCDDGNNLNGDGCSVDCVGESFMEYLFPQDKFGDYIKNGSWGGFNYTDVDFIFKGYYLSPGTDYTLIRRRAYPPLITCLEFGIADSVGDLALIGDMKEGGDELWLVLSDDISCATGSGAFGNEITYLFTEGPIFEATMG